jgi:hypothetical protein
MYDILDSQGAKEKNRTKKRRLNKEEEDEMGRGSWSLCNALRATLGSWPSESGLFLLFHSIQATNIIEEILELIAYSLRKNTKPNFLAVNTCQVRGHHLSYIAL